MEIEYGTAKEVKLKRIRKKTMYMAFFTYEDPRDWHNGSLYETEQEAINDLRYYQKATRLHLVTIELPVPNVADGVEIITGENYER